MPTFRYSVLVAVSLLLSCCHSEPDFVGRLRGVNTSSIFTPRDSLASTGVFRIIIQDTHTFETNSSVFSEEIGCIPIVNGDEDDEVFSIVFPDDGILEDNEDLLHGGSLFVAITDFEKRSDQIVLSSSSEIHVVMDPRTQTRKHRSPALGRKSIAVIRISTLDSEPSDDLETLRNGLFGDNEVNLKTQFEACSFGKLQFYLSETGVIDVLVPEKIENFTSGSSLVHAAQHVMKHEMRIGNVAKIADKVLMCLPPGTGSWVASSGVNHWRAQFNDGWCRSLTATMHELGHTLGLNHANRNGKSYGDSTGYMAAGHRQTDWPRKCFNGQKNWHLGWYYSRQETIRMSALEKGTLVELATFVDFDISDHDEPVLLNIADSYFLQYNVAKGFNIDTEQKKNMVTITAPTGKGSDSIEGLDVGGVYTELFFEKSMRTLIIEACRAIKGKHGADVMVISVALDRSLCGPRIVDYDGVQQGKMFFEPTKAPEVRPYIGLDPTMIFSNGHVKLPTRSIPPAKAPTKTSKKKPPTAQPTRNPTSVPTRSPTLQPIPLFKDAGPAIARESTRTWKLIDLMQSVNDALFSDPTDPPQDTSTVPPAPVVSSIFDISTVEEKRPAEMRYSSGVTSIFGKRNGT